MLYVIGSLLFISAWPQNPYTNQMDAVTVLAIQKNAFFGLMEVLTLLVVFSLIGKKNVTGGAISLIFIWGVGTLATLSLPMTGNSSPPNNGLWFGNPSMGASLLACVLPFAWAIKLKIPPITKEMNLTPPILWCLTLLVIYRTGASVPWGVLGVVTAAYLIAGKPKKAWLLSGISIVSLAIGMIYFGQKLLGSDFWDENRRFEIWHMAWDWFKSNGRLSVGMGYSTSQILLPIEQVITGHFHGDYFLWLHNDWLQLAIEGGYVGMFCVFLSLFRLVKISWYRPTYFASLMGFVTLALFNYPLRMPIHCYCLALICGMLEAVTRSAERDARKQIEVLKKIRSAPLSEFARS